MAHHKSAKKRIVLSAKQNLRNRADRSRINNALKNVLQSDSKESINEDFRLAVKLLDKMACKGLLHKNNAARKKSRLARHVSSVLQG